MYRLPIFSSSYSQSLRLGTHSTLPAQRICLASTRQMSMSVPMKGFPSDAYQFLPTTEKAGAAEDVLFREQREEVRRSWASERFKGIKRPYSPEDVVSKRGTLQQTYPSSLMARKLFNLLNTRAKSGQPVHTSELAIHVWHHFNLIGCSGSH